MGVYSITNPQFELERHSPGVRGRLERERVLRVARYHINHGLDEKVFPPSTPHIILTRLVVFSSPGASPPIRESHPHPIWFPLRRPKRVRVYDDQPGRCCCWRAVSPRSKPLLCPGLRVSEPKFFQGAGPVVRDLGKLQTRFNPTYNEVDESNRRLIKAIALGPGSAS